MEDTELPSPVDSAATEFLSSPVWESHSETILKAADPSLNAWAPMKSLASWYDAGVVSVKMKTDAIKQTQLHQTDRQTHTHAYPFFSL